MLLYSLLHLTGYEVSPRRSQAVPPVGQQHPRSPRYGLTPGVEATTGPLGQGLANAVGMAIAERRLAAEFNPPGHDDRRPLDVRASAPTATSRRASPRRRRSLAGHLRLGKLVILYDDNHVQLDGPTAMAWSEDVPKRFDAYGWHTQRVADGNDVAAIEAAIEAARADDRPSLIAVRTHIGYGSPNKQDTQKAHGSPLGPDEVRLVKEAYGWDPDRTFYVPDEAAALFHEAVGRGETLVQEWEARFDRYAADHRDEAAEFRRRIDRHLADGWDTGLKTYETGTEVATRNASQDAIQALAPRVPELFGGAADLSESNLTDVKGAPDFSADVAGRNLRFGVREHGMGGASNGIAYHGGFIPYCATFLTFSDYMRGSVRLASLSGLHVIYVWTHDSVGLGEDGPTHQPVEHYAALRAIPNLWFVRPGDANETAAAWALAVERGGVGPVALALTRQKLPTLAGTAEHAREGVAPRRLRAARRERGRTRSHPDRHGLGAPTGVRGRRGASRPTASRRASCRSLLGAVRAPGRRPTATRSCRRTSARGSASRPASRSAGSAGSATRARSSGSITSAHRRRPARSSSTSGSRRPCHRRRPRASSARACADGSRPSMAATSVTSRRTRTAGRARAQAPGQVRARARQARTELPPRTPATADPKAVGSADRPDPRSSFLHAEPSRSAGVP